MLDRLDCVNNINIDLHNHTVYSDGDMRPEALVDKYIEEGKEIIAITDHDGIEGSAIALSYAVGKPIELIPGIEFDSDDELGKEIHMLGYYIDYGNEELLKTIEQTKLWRDERNEKLFEILNMRGYKITHEQINSINNGIFVGKPNFAKALIENGYAKDINDAFSNILREDEEIGRILKDTHQTEQIIEVIHAAGGQAVMAHPMEQQRKGEPRAAFYERLNIIMDRMLEYGVDGIECYHPSATAQESEMLRKYAEKNGLYITRGSDFHSEIRVRTYGRIYSQE